jgi:hypothetical protein
MATGAVEVPASECESGDVPCAHTFSFQSERTHRSILLNVEWTSWGYTNLWPLTTIRYGTIISLVSLKHGTIDFILLSPILTTCQLVSLTA